VASMKLKDVPNAICILRIVMVVVLWGIALAGWRRLFAPLLAFTYLTDVVDGYIARRYHVESALGAKLDTIADNLVAISLLGWVYFFLPRLLEEQWPIIGAILVAFIGSIALQYVRFRRRVPLHLYSNKLSAWTLALFLMHALLFGSNLWFFYVAAAVVGYSLLEEIVLVSTRTDLDETVKSMFSRRA
jgi:cardiolipin synthase